MTPTPNPSEYRIYTTHHDGISREIEIVATSADQAGREAIEFWAELGNAPISADVRIVTR